MLGVRGVQGWMEREREVLLTVLDTVQLKPCRVVVLVISTITSFVRAKDSSNFSVYMNSSASFTVFCAGMPVMAPEIGRAHV